MDSMFHFHKSDLEVETKLLTGLLRDVKSEAIIVLFIQYNKARIKTLHKVIEMSEVSTEMKEEKIFMYKEFKSEFYMCVLQKK